MMWVATVAVVMLQNAGLLVYGQDPACPPGRYGPGCVCTEDTSNKTCFNPLAQTAIACSGRGDCICGMCQCRPRRRNSAQLYSGEFCQCDDYACNFHMNMLCGGNGRCVCGMCVCDEGYTGDACGCPTSNSTCLASNGKLCNDVGECVCGRCQCSKTSSFKGPTCEECPTCPGQCQANKNCAFCKAFQAGYYTQEECDANCRHVELVDQLDEEAIKNDDRKNMCQFTDAEDDCRIWFSYTYTEVGVQVDVQTTKICSNQGNHGNRELSGLIGLMLSATCIYMFI